MLFKYLVILFVIYSISKIDNVLVTKSHHTNEEKFTSFTIRLFEHAGSNCTEYYC